jgi:hypothetical protein
MSRIEVVHSLLEQERTDEAIRLIADASDKKSRLSVALSIVSAFVAVVALWNGAPGFQAPFCRDVAITPKKICSLEHRAISEVEAAIFFDAYFGHAGASYPPDAWMLLDDRERSRYTGIEDFVANWDEVTRAERISEVTLFRDVFNTFRVEYRRFEVPVIDGKPNNESENGVISERRMVATLEKIGEDTIVLKQVLRDTRTTTAAEQRKFIYVLIPDAIDLRRHPDADSVVSFTARPGALFRIQCKTASTEPTWFYTPMGWFPADVAGLEEGTADRVVDQCSDFAVEAALAAVEEDQEVR